VSFLTVERAIDNVAGIGQRCGQLAIKVGIVFNDEQAHAGLRV
jgi:hypothetical protein